MAVRYNKQNEIHQVSQPADPVLSVPGEFILQSFFEEALLGMAIINLRGEIVKANNVFTDILGYTRKELCLMTFRELTYPDDLALTETLFKEIIKGEINSYNIEKRCIHKNGTVIWVNVHVALVKDASDKSAFLTVQLENITDRVTYAELIAAKAMQLTNIADNLPDSVIYQVIREPDGKPNFVYVSNGIQKLVEVSSDEVMQNPLALYEMIHPDDRQMFAEAELLSFQKVQPFRIQVRIILPSGKIKIMQLSSNPRKLDEKRVLWDGFATDITVKKESEARILQLSRIYQFKSRVNGLMLRCTDRDKIFSELCSIAVEFGKVEMAWVGLISDDKETVMPHVWAGKEEGYLTKVKITARNNFPESKGPCGRAIHTKALYYSNDIANDPIMAPWREEALKRNYRSSIALPILVNNEVVALFTLYMSKEFFFDPTEVGLLQNVVDNISFGLDKLRITELQKKVEEDLRKSEEVNRAIVAAFPDKIMRVTKDGTVLNVHMQTDNELYVPKENSINSKFTDYLPYAVADLMTKALSKAFRTKKLVTIEVMLPINAQTYFHEVRMVAMSQGEALVIIRDITEAKEAEKVLKDSLNELSSYKYAIDQSSLVDISDKDGRMIYVNEKFCETSQFTSEELLGQDHRMLNSNYHEKIFFANLWETVLSGKVWQGEVREKAKDGHYFWLATTIIPFMDLKGEPYQYVSIRKDITIRKQAENELLKKNHEIKKRVKELCCLYRISELSNNEKYSMQEVLKECLCIIPDAYQYPEITGVRIRFEGVQFQTDYFKETQWFQFAAIKTNDKMIGSVEVFYTTEMPEEQEGPFLKEERLLINSIADILGTSTDQKKAQQLLQESERKFRALVEQSTIGVYILQDGVFKYVNVGLEKITGYKIGELLGRPFTELMHKDDLERVVGTYQKRIAGKIGNEDQFFRIVNARGETIYLQVMPSVITYEGRVAVMGSIIDITDRLEEEKRINNAVIQGQEREKIEIGMELHDNVKQILAASQMSLHQVRKKIETGSKSALPYIDQTKDLIAQAVEELRRLTHQLAPVVDINLPFHERIEILMNEMNTGNDLLTLDLSIDEIDKLVTKEALVNIFRIIQEQFVNIKKHAHATRVGITIQNNDKVLIISVADNGHGFDPVIKKEGIGLENIKRRTDFLGGEMKIITSPGNGCELIVTIPLPELSNI